MTGLPILFKLLIAHFAGDFLLQPSRIVANRNKSLFSPALGYHLLIHLVCILVLFLFDIEWFMVAAILVSHGFIDLLKTGAEMRLKQQASAGSGEGALQSLNIWTFVIDQALHLIVIGLVWLIATDQAGVLYNWSV
ncbi:MAG TPA: DUF3307 domain-containing protein, partial [Sphingobacteriaceae bacterium]